MHHTRKSAVIIRGNLIFNISDKILCFLKYISKDLGPMISLEMIPSAPTKLMYH